MYEKDSSHFYGFTYFRQTRDVRIKRGFFQKSVVILTRLPYVTFFKQALDFIAPEFFERGRSALLQACKNINTWPAPIPGTTYDLPLYDYTLRTRIPQIGENTGFEMYLGNNNLTDKNTTKNSSLSSSPKSSTKNNADVSKNNSNISEVCLIPKLADTPIWSTQLRHIIPHLQVLWELTLLNEPLVLIANHPVASSECVLAILSLIQPLRYQGEFRPYFTIHDSEYHEFTGKEISPPPSCLLGVTNPFFVKQLPHWPHLVKLDADSIEEGTAKIRPIEKLKDIDAKPGIYTSYRANLQPCSTTFSQLTSSKASRRPDQVQDAVIKRYFNELTTSFMMPLERYAATCLMPLKREINPWKSPPQIKQFRAENFFASIDSKGPQLTTKIKGNWMNLYQAFVRSPNFFGWLERRQRSMNDIVTKLHLESICDITVDDEHWKNTSVVERVDQILRFKKQLRELENVFQGICSSFKYERSDIVQIFDRVLENSQKLKIVDGLRKVVDRLILQLPDDTKELVRNANV